MGQIGYFYPENLNSLFFIKIASRGSLAWLWRQTHDLESNLLKIRCPEVAGSTPAPGTKLFFKKTRDLVTF